MFKNFFQRRSSMANEQNEQAQDIQNEQQTEQTQAESVEQANELSVEDLQAQITKLEESLKLEKARTANAVYEAQKSVVPKSIPIIFAIWDVPLKFCESPNFLFGQGDLKRGFACYSI